MWCATSLKKKGFILENKQDIVKKGKVRKKSKPKEYFDALLFAGLVAIFLKLFFIEAYRIPTGSMENTLLVGDFLLVNKFVYGATTPRNMPFTDIRIPYFRLPSLKDPHKGDVVVFDFPGNRDEFQSAEVVNYIKRLAGEPGDTIQIINKVLKVNGQEFPDPPNSILDHTTYKTTITDSRIFPKGSGWNEDNYGPLYVPKKGDVIKLTSANFDMWKMFILREGHTPVLTNENKISIDNVQSVEYKVEKDYYFMMGDNRNNSLDSRFWGFMPKDNVVGEALIIYWSWDPSVPFSDFGKLVSTIRWNRIAKLIK
jgi:signal peptidase I